MKLFTEDFLMINSLDRAKIIKLLENVGIACYDSETTDELRDALVANIEDDTIEVEDVETIAYGY